MPLRIAITGISKVATMARKKNTNPDSQTSGEPSEAKESANAPSIAPLPAAPGKQPKTQPSTSALIICRNKYVYPDSEHGPLHRWYKIVLCRESTSVQPSPRADLISSLTFPQSDTGAISPHSMDHGCNSLLRCSKALLTTTTSYPVPDL